ncbi:hypothetical protein V6R21_29855 [Limibacter armeniacum]|uniref:hypothetical protein n=1 Tax=Limibacter armeniacum TaxID=466084 RepID=UPI002FE5B890
MKKILYISICCTLSLLFQSCYYDGDLGEDGEDFDVVLLPNSTIAGEYTGRENCDGGEFDYHIVIASFKDSAVVIDNIFDSSYRVVANVTDENTVEAEEQVELGHDYAEGEEILVSVSNFTFTKDEDGVDDQISFDFTIINRADTTETTCSYTGIRYNGFEEFDELQ